MPWSFTAARLAVLEYGPMLELPRLSSASPSSNYGWKLQCPEPTGLRIGVAACDPQKLHLPVFSRDVAAPAGKMADFAHNGRIVFVLALVLSSLRIQNDRSISELAITCRN